MPTIQLLPFQDPPKMLRLEDLGSHLPGLYPLKAAPVTAPPKLLPPPNAIVYPTLAGLGFIFPEGVAVGETVALPRRCPTCGHEREGTVKPGGHR